MEERREQGASCTAERTLSESVTTTGGVGAVGSTMSTRRIQIDLNDDDQDDDDVPAHADREVRQVAQVPMFVERIGNRIVMSFNEYNR